MKLIQHKQIEGLVEDLAELFGNVSAISVGTPTLQGTVLSIPFTNKDGVTTPKSVDLASLAVDVQVASATIDANTYELTVTETNGDTNTVSLATILANYIAQNVTPQVQQAQATASQAQASANTAQQTAQQAQTTANQAIQDASNALSVGNQAQQSANQAALNAQTAQERADDAHSLGEQARTEAASAQVTANTANATANQVKDRKLDAIGFWSKKTMTASVATGLVEVSTVTAPVSETNCVAFVTVNGVTHAVEKAISAPFFVSADNGATAVATFETAGAKVFCNVTALSYSLEAGDELSIFAGISLPRLGIAY